MVNSNKEGKNLYSKLNSVTEQFLQVRLDYLGCISEDQFLRKAVKQQKAVFEKYPSAKISTEFKKIAEIVQQWPHKDDGVGNTQFFIERLIANADQ